LNGLEIGSSLSKQEDEMGSMKDLLDGIYVPPGGGAYARKDDPATSKRAAASVKVNAKEQIVIDTLTRFGPLTTRQVSEKSGADLQSITPRMKPLEKKGKIARCDPAPGESRTVWRLVG
jgi:hypothetical protein